MLFLGYFVPLLIFSVVIFNSVRGVLRLNDVKVVLRQGLRNFQFYEITPPKRSFSPSSGGFVPYLNESCNCNDREQILNDKGLGHSLLELSNLIVNQKYIWPLVVEFESTLNDKNEMQNALREYQSLLFEKTTPTNL